jgi:hypothetical protein
VTSEAPAPVRHGQGFVASALFVWLILAIVVGASGRMAGLRPPRPQIIVGILTLVASAAVFAIPALRDWVKTVPIAGLVAWHLTRLVAGAYFLILAAQLTLPRSFAVPAGIGDIAVGVIAAVLLLTINPGSVTGVRWHTAWNVFGLLDIIFVVVNAARTGLAQPASMAPLLRLPLSILPSFLVPTIFVCHFILIQRLRSKESDG